ncbi:MAG: hypothetical protein G3M70_17830 [Candidatus Nitronauta litoralis]|uniref:Uncharacterized protein n=1 Tax=Candidatus Nitronauta litoralis TaxID=2705533 RepID=A0A7T0BZ83_9BACT|nr:MAG: hypothetical protein G3M70_17830 [Candidatus Nitronauta litoralis]
MKISDNIFRFSLAVALTGCAAFLLAASLSSAAPPPPLIEKLDSHYYYPQREGIKSLKFSIHWAQLDPFADTEDKKLLNNPTVIFNWKAGQDKPDFEIDESAGSVSPIRELEILKFMSQYAEVFMPIPLSKTLDDYTFKGKKQRKGYLEARFSTDSAHPIMQYDFKIDPRHWNIKTLLLRRQHSPFNVTSHLKYADRNGKSQVLESRSRFEMNGKKYEETLEFFYSKIEGYWLPTRVRQQLKEGTKLANSYIFTFAGYKIN